MQRIPVVLIIAVCLLLAASGFSYSQDHGKHMGKKEMSKDETAMGPLKKIQCDSPCDFSIASRDESEVISLVKMHVKTHHHMDVSDTDLKGMIKTEDAKEMKGMKETKTESAPKK